MMALKIWKISLSNQCPYNQPIYSPKTFTNISFPKSPFLAQNQNCPQNQYNPGVDTLFVASSSKRKLNISILAILVNGSLQNIISSAILAHEDLELERYTDTKAGFTLLKPTSYIKVDKAGATVLFEEVNEGGNNVGVVVNPVRLTRLGDFGSPEFVADKLIQAEKRKESTKEAEVIGVVERSGNGGLQVYEFEYKLYSTRGGLKRVFSAAFVASKKLYLLNIVHSDKAESPLDKHTREALEKVLHSFDAAPMA